MSYCCIYKSGAVLPSTSQACFGSLFSRTDSLLKDKETKIYIFPKSNELNHTFNGEFSINTALDYFEELNVVFGGVTYQVVTYKDIIEKVYKPAGTTSKSKVIIVTITHNDLFGNTPEKCRINFKTVLTLIRYTFEARPRSKFKEALEAKYLSSKTILESLFITAVKYQGDNHEISYNKQELSADKISKFKINKDIVDNFYKPKSMSVSVTEYCRKLINYDENSSS